MGCHDIIQVVRHKHHFYCSQYLRKMIFNLIIIIIFLYVDSVVLSNILIFFTFTFFCSSEDFEVMDQIFCTGGNNDDPESFLERDYNYRLHIHTRDFRVGQPILSNIVEGITCSRHLTVLLSM